MTTLSAAPPLERPRHAIGRRTITLVDPARGDRSVPVDVWYPAVESDAPRSLYDLLPGVSFEAASALHEPDALTGRWPLIVMSHGRTGMRISYSLICEALAARGAVVVSADHAGDTLLDWLLGTHVDDVTNETNRVGDISLVLDRFVLDADTDRVMVIGHSYGAHGALSAVAGRRGLAPDRRIRAVVGLQPYTRLLSDAALIRVDVPTLIVASGNDRTTPPDTDADRPCELITGRPLWRLDLAGAAHQAASDMGMYAELAHLVELPDIVRQYLDATTVDAVGPGIPPYRELLAIQMEAISRFSAAAFDGDDSGWSPDTAGVHLTRR